MAGRYRQDGKRIRSVTTGERIRCVTDCCDSPTNCFADKVTFTGCDTPSDIVACLANMFSAVQLRFEDVTTTDKPFSPSFFIEWSKLNGTYPIWNPIGHDPAIFYGNEVAETMVDKSDGATAFLFFDDCSLGPLVRYLLYSAECYPPVILNQLRLEVGMIPYDAGANVPTFEAVANFDFPIDIFNGVEFDLTPINVTDNDEWYDDRCAVYFPKLISAKLIFYGKPCNSTPCTDGPTADWTATNETIGIDACSGFPEEVTLSTGCFYNVTTTVTPGRCPIKICFWSDGTEGCDPATLVISSNCGTKTSIPRTLFVVDTVGCIAESTKEFTCCNCCPPTGDVTVTPPSDVIVDGEAGVVDCGNQDEPRVIWSYFSVIFGDTTSTCNTSRYQVSWNGLQDPDGIPLTDQCYEAGTEIFARRNVGAISPGYCMKVIVVDQPPYGCASEPVYFLFGAQHVCFEEGCCDSSEDPCCVEHAPCPPE